MRRSLLSGSFVAAVLAVVGAGCSSSTTTPTTPTTPSAVTETFTGTLTVNGSVTFPYVVAQAGSTNATIKSLDPVASVTVKSGGTGNFEVGETVYQGDSLDTATWTAVVNAWLPGSQIAVSSMTGTFTADGAIVGSASGARWTGDTVATTVVGLALGTWSGTVCSVVLTADLAGVGSAIYGQVQGQGSLCARVYDVGKITAPATFTVEVTHF